MGSQYGQLELTTYSLCNDDWKIIFPNEFKSNLIDNSEISSEVSELLQKYLQQTTNDFREQIEISGITFLVGFFFSKKEVRLYTPFLSQELFWLSLQEEGHNSEEVEHIQLAKNLNLNNFPSQTDQLTQRYKLWDPSTTPLKEMDPLLKTTTEKLVGEMRRYRPSLFEKVTDELLALTAQFALLRIHLLKFLAILPSLDYDTKGVEVKRLLLEAIRRLSTESSHSKKNKVKNEWRALPDSLLMPLNIFALFAKMTPPALLAGTIRFLVKLMAKRFIAGETIEKAHKSLAALYKSGRDATCDQLGELVVSESEADHYCDEVINIIKGMKQHIPRGEKNKAGILKAHVSIKVSALASDFRIWSMENTYKLVSHRLTKILVTAKEEQVFINIDAEHYHYRDMVFKIYQKVLLETNELKDFDQTGIVLQGYLRDAYVHFLDILDLAKKRNLKMPIRLVKGAYWDAETVEADAHSFMAPEFLNKEETDIHFRQLCLQILDNHQFLKLCLAGHNFSDHAFAEAYRETYLPNSDIIEHQCLHMTYEALSVAISKLGWVSRNYVPIGGLLVGMGYLVRRIMENSSQVGVLTMMRTHTHSTSTPSPWSVHSEKRKDSKLNWDHTQKTISPEFFNISPVRAYVPSQHSKMLESLDQFQKNGLNKKYENSFSLSGDWVSLKSSSDTQIEVGSIQFASTDDVVPLVTSAQNALKEGTWGDNQHWKVRAMVLNKLGLLFNAKRYELASLIIYEAGKTVEEALADVDEAIDFLHFYARQEQTLQENSPHLNNRGVLAVIAPWNFPLAIPCGMCSAALVAGNAVILKSAEQTPLIAQVLCDMFHQAGVPKDILIHAPGVGETVGASLIKHPYVNGAIFTGGKVAGEEIYKTLKSKSVTNPRGEITSPASVITEMGGKNAMIVTANAELDETVSGIIYSAFGHAGQKCSALGRIIVHESIADRLSERLKEAISDLHCSQAFDLATYVNPIITEFDRDRLKRQAKEAIEEAVAHGGKAIIDRSNEDLPGLCVGPVLISIPRSLALDKTSYAQKELFGPIVHICSYSELNEAIEVFNSTNYGLTGGVYAQSEDDIEYIVSKIESGNIYINRTITGARVAIEPFGGFKLSGTGPKAGGLDYLRQLHQYQSPQAKTMLERKVAEADGSSYNFDIANRDKTPNDLRLKHFHKLFRTIITQYSGPFSGHYSKNKNDFIEFQKWSQQNLEDLINERSHNRQIPGQKNLNDKSLTGNKLVILPYGRPADMSTVYYFMAAIGLGLGVTVVCRDQETFNWWNIFKDFYIAAFHGHNCMDVFLSNEELLEKTLVDPSVDYYIIEGPIERVTKLSNISLSVPAKHIKKILTPYDCPPLENHQEYYQSFIHVRSLAINTMRHGAPMERVLP
jgi:RHH-type transcriptional regulator, proline utilization regulon repressor / proline dehydrogenase / delta 1-pyrroline-5-carboxylate dehydrogenase